MIRSEGNERRSQLIIATVSPDDFKTRTVEYRGSWTPVERPSLVLYPPIGEPTGGVTSTRATPAVSSSAAASRMPTPNSNTTKTQNLMMLIALAPNVAEAGQVIDTLDQSRLDRSRLTLTTYVLYALTQSVEICCCAFSSSTSPLQTNL